MNFEFLYQDNEGVYSLIERKTKVLTFTSLAGFLTTVILTVVFLFDIDRTKFIPGIIVLGAIFALSIILLIKGNYKASVRSIFILPLALYLFYINDYYSIVDVENSLSGMLTFVYFSLLFLIVFGGSIALIGFFYLESVMTLLYFLYSNKLMHDGSSHEIRGVFFSFHPLFELTSISLLAALLYVYFDGLIVKTANEQLRARKLIEESLRQFNSGIIQLEIVRDEQGEKAGMKIVRMNNYFERLFKVSKVDVADTDASEIFPLIFRDSFNWQDVYLHSRKNSLQVYIEHIDRWFNVYNVFPDNDMIISCFFNISDMKHEVDRLQARESRLTNLLGSLPDIFFIIENDGTYVDYVTTNPELMMLGQKDIIGKTIFEMGFSKAMTYQIYSSIQYVIENDNIETIEYGMDLPNGKALIFEMRLARLNDTQVISIGRDITSNKEYEQQLIEAKRKTEEASRLKSSFLENISHEIRTPMNAILGFSNMTLSDDYTETERRRFIEIVLKNGEYLMDVITNIIDISEIESGSVEYNPSEFRINDLFLGIYNKHLNQTISKKPNINLKLVLGNEKPDFTIESDNFLLLKIINHLVENAIKFTHEGTVVFGYEMVGDEIKIFAQDTGIGIDKSDSDTIFEFFHQLDNRVSRTYSGTGAGLKIVKSLAEILGSKIELESQPRRGSTFFFYIPIKTN
jgi:signal transduction histidine kinase